jgi:hypothetical protein
MLIYLFLFALPAFMSIIYNNNQKVNNKDNYNFLAFKLFFIFLFFIIGFRFEVGGDWFEYVNANNKIIDFTFNEYLFSGDPSDRFLNFISFKLNFGIYFVNFIYSLFFSYGLFLFCKNQPRPWLALTISIPYLVIVVAMGYSRQGVAIGIILIGLIILEKGKIYQFILIVAFAATFHKSAILMIPLALLINRNNFIFKFFIVFVTVLLLYLLLLKESFDLLIVGYIDSQYSSSGAAIRVAMNAFPGLIFLFFKSKFKLTKLQLNFWSWLSIFSLLFVFLIMNSNSSTAIDRVSLYLIPLQLFIFSRLPDALGNNFGGSFYCNLLVIIYYAIVLITWLFFSIHSFAWLPYKFLPLFFLWN